MTPIISILNLKGGIGKTFFTFNLGGSFAAPQDRLGLNQKVLIVDCDPQGSLSKKFIPSDPNFGPTLNDFFSPDTSINFKDCIHSGEKLKSDIGLSKEKAAIFKNLDILPLKPGTRSFFRRLEEEQEYALREELQALGNIYDYIFIDCTNQPGFNLSTALLASTLVLIPITCDVETVECYMSTKKHLSFIQKYKNKDLSILGVVANLYKENRKSERSFVEDMIPEIMSKENLYFFKTVVKDMSAFKESINQKLPINVFEPRSSDANKLFYEFIKEFYSILH